MVEWEVYKLKVNAMKEARLELINLTSVGVLEDGRVSVPVGKCSGRMMCPGEGPMVLKKVGLLVKRWEIVEVNGQKMRQIDEELRLYAAANCHCETACPCYEKRRVG